MKLNYFCYYHQLEKKKMKLNYVCYYHYYCYTRDKIFDIKGFEILALNCKN